MIHLNVVEFMETSFRGDGKNSLNIENIMTA